MYKKISNKNDENDLKVKKQEGLKKLKDMNRKQCHINRREGTEYVKKLKTNKQTKRNVEKNENDLPYNKQEYINDMLDV